MTDLIVKDLLTQAAGAAPPARLDLDAAVARGRRLRTRARAARVGGGLVAAALVTGAVLADPWSPTGPGGGSGVTVGSGIPQYRGPAFVPSDRWAPVVGSLLPGRVLAGSGGGSDRVVNLTYRLQRDGRTALVRVDLYSGGGGTDGRCALGMTRCSDLRPAPQVPGATLLAYELDPEYAHEGGHAVALLRGRSPDRTGDGTATGVEVVVTAVAADAGPDGRDGVGEGRPADPLMTRSELVALVQELPLPEDAKPYLPPA